MEGGYETVFEVSYLSNGTLLTSLAALAFGVAVLAAGLGPLRRHLRGRRPVWVAWCALWLPLSALAVAVTLGRAWAYTSALRDGRCEVAEGVVEVLHRQPYGGHDPGDRVRVGGREFRVSAAVATVAYARSLAHGGALTDGARVRVHHLGGAILKVEGWRAAAP